MKSEIQHYLNSYRKIVPELSDEELEFVNSNIKILELKKKEIYIDEGEVQKSIGFIFSGLMRSYFVDSNGKEITNAFFAENQFATDYLAFIKQHKTKYNFECLEDGVVISIPYKTVKTAYETYSNFASFGRKIAEWALETRTNKYESFLFENAEERYLRFLNENKTIANRVTLTQLASYLGIERQSLSRLRSKILSQK